MEILQIRIRQIGIPLPDIIYCLIQPMALILLGGLKDTATMHVTEQLIASSVEEFIFGQVALRFIVMLRVHLQHTTSRS